MAIQESSIREMQPFKLGINKFAIKAKFGNQKTMNLGLV